MNFMAVVIFGLAACSVPLQRQQGGLRGGSRHHVHLLLVHLLLVHLLLVHLLLRWGAMSIFVQPWLKAGDICLVATFEAVTATAGLLASPT